MLVKTKPLLLIMSYILSIFTMLKLCFLLETGQRESSHVWITSLNYLSRKNKESKAEVFHPREHRGMKPAHHKTRAIVNTCTSIGTGAKRLRAHWATEGHKSYLHMHLILQITGQNNALKERGNHKQYAICKSRGQLLGQLIGHFESSSCGH